MVEIKYGIKHLSWILYKTKINNSEYQVFTDIW